MRKYLCGIIYFVLVTVTLLSRLIGDKASHALQTGRIMNGEQDKEQSDLISALEEAGIEIQGEGTQYLLATDPKAQRAIEMILDDAKLQEVENESLLHNQVFSAGWSFCVVDDPKDWHDTQGPSARWLDLTFDGSDWDALFRHYLNNQGGASVYPMLYRIEPRYADVIYKADDIEQLYYECQSAQIGTADSNALNALQKLALACSEALKDHKGLFLAGP